MGRTHRTGVRLIKQIPSTSGRDPKMVGCLRETTGCSSHVVNVKLGLFLFFLWLEGKTSAEVGSVTTTKHDAPHV